MKSTSLRAAPTNLPRVRLRLVSMLAISILLAAGTVLTQNPSAAQATKYPSWADVVAARRSAAASKAEVKHIRNLIASLGKQLTAAQADAEAKGKIAYAAQQKYLAGQAKQQKLQAQVTAAAKKAAQSKQELGEYAAQLARGADGSGGTTLSLFLNGGSADQLLNDLGAIDQVSTRENRILVLALSEQKSANQLTAEAAAQAKILAKQKQEADAAEAAATAAAEKLQTALTAQTEHEKTLKVELAALTTKLKMTEKQYNKGIAASGLGGHPGVVDSQGWALPTAGVITSPWGYRYDPAAGYSWRMHYGDDIAHGCLQPIYAAHSGTVSYAGPYGDIGNYIVINHGGGVSTAYGHIASGNTFVRIGQHVSSGQNIARTGSTGTSTGCHLYFQVEVNGSYVNPVPFMRARGIRIG